MLLIFIFSCIIIAFDYIVKDIRYRKTEYYDQTHLSYLQMRLDKGRYGEYLTYKSLNQIAGYKKYLFNCYIPKEDGNTTEIDVILLHESGIYVFESKNYSGWIFGTETQKQWTQVLPVGKGKSQKSHFMNPIIQNKVHIKWLQNYIGREYSFPIYSFIVFSERCTLKDVTLTSYTHHVVNRYNLTYAVKQNTSLTEYCISSEKIDALFNKLYPLTQVSEAQKLVHVMQFYQENVEVKKFSAPGNVFEKEATGNEGEQAGGQHAKNGFERQEGRSGLLGLF